MCFISCPLPLTSQLPRVFRVVSVHSFWSLAEILFGIAVCFSCDAQEDVFRCDKLNPHNTSTQYDGYVFSQSLFQYFIALETLKILLFVDIWVVWYSLWDTSKTVGTNPDLIDVMLLHFICFLEFLFYSVLLWFKVCIALLFTISIHFKVVLLSFITNVPCL